MANTCNIISIETLRQILKQDFMTYGKKKKGKKKGC